jgi:hypothetical protein
MIDPKAPCPFLSHEEAKQLNLLATYSQDDRAKIGRAYHTPRNPPTRVVVHDTATARSITIRHDPKEEAKT